MANARQFMAERTAAWAKSGGGIPTARDYDADIIVIDGIDNNGYDDHHDAIAEPVDLLGHTSFAGNGLADVGSNYFTINKQWFHSGDILDFFNDPDECTVEVVFKPRDWSWSYRALFSLCPNDDIDFELFKYVGEYRDGRNFYIANNSTRVGSYLKKTSLANNLQHATSFVSTFSASGCKTYINGELSDVYDSGTHRPVDFYDMRFYVGETSGRLNQSMVADIHAIRLSSFIMSSEQVRKNYAIDKARFGLT